MSCVLQLLHTTCTVWTFATHAALFRGDGVVKARDIPGSHRRQAFLEVLQRQLVVLHQRLVLLSDLQSGTAVRAAGAGMRFVWWVVRACVRTCVRGARDREQEQEHRPGLTDDAGQQYANVPLRAVFGV